MSYIDWKKLKERVSLRDILDHYDLLSDLEEAPHGYAGSCPFCGSNAFKVNVEKNAWFCFGDCKEAAEVNGTHNGGNILDFVARLEEVSVKTGAEKIAAWFPEEPVKAGREGARHGVGCPTRDVDRRCHTRSSHPERKYRQRPRKARQARREARQRLLMSRSLPCPNHAPPWKVRRTSSAA